MKTVRIFSRCLKGLRESFRSSIGKGEKNLNASVENVGIPFAVQHKSLPYSLQEAVFDSRTRRNLNGPFDSAEDAVASMLED